MRFRHFWNNRTACGVLEEMREVIKVSSASITTKALLNCLIEELQVMYNKMEAGIADRKDFLEIREETSKAKKYLYELEKKAKALGGYKDEE